MLVEIRGYPHYLILAASRASASVSYVFKMQGLSKKDLSSI